MPSTKRMTAAVRKERKGGWEEAFIETDYIACNYNRSGGDYQEVAKGIGFSFFFAQDSSAKYASDAPLGK
jgi:hypothetical protein